MPLQFPIRMPARARVCPGCHSVTACLWISDPYRRLATYNSHSVTKIRCDAILTSRSGSRETQPAGRPVPTDDENVWNEVTGSAFAADTAVQETIRND